jgi:hypothetical protein
MDGCFSAFHLVHGFHPAGEEASCISEVPGLTKQVSSPASTSAFKKACAPFTDVSPFFLFSSDVELDAGRLRLSTASSGDMIGGMPKTAKNRRLVLPSIGDDHVRHGGTIA